jgi:ABC-2 type transport system permease protein
VNGLRLYGRYIGVSLRAQMQYPASFVAMSVGSFVATVMDFVAIWALFARFDRIAGWRFHEVALFYGVVSVAFALADTVTRGFDIFGPTFVKTGDFDRLLVRPRSALLQLLGYELRATRIGRLAQGVLACGVAVHLSTIHWTWQAWATLVFAVVGGMALFCGVLVFQATLSFWTVESLEVVNTLTYGGIEAGQYPLDIYARWFRTFLIFVVPIGCISYFPVASVLGHADRTGVPPWILPLAPVLGFVFLGLTLRGWRAGVRRYTSTGS